MTGLYRTDGTGWRQDAIEQLKLPGAALPTVVDSSGLFGEATALPGRPPLRALVGDQQASLVGQGCTRPGLAKATFGTGAMLDVSSARPGRHSPSGATAAASRSSPGSVTVSSTWGVEAIMLAAGTAVDWLVEDLGLLGRHGGVGIGRSSMRRHRRRGGGPRPGRLRHPAMGLWSAGCAVRPHRGERAGQEISRAVLEGIAHSGADLLEAAECDAGLDVGHLRIDGGMSANGVFVRPSPMPATARWRSRRNWKPPPWGRGCSPV